MEIFELRYFLAAAQTQNLHKASESLRVSPASIGKAVQRLEAELGVKLFSRKGRNIEITDHGRLLQKKAAEIVRLEENAKVAVGGHRGALNVSLAGPEVLLSGEGLVQASRVLKRHPGATFQFLHCAGEAEALAMVQRGEVHLALVTTSEVPADLTSRVVGESTFRTYCGDDHPLAAKARAGKEIPVEVILTHPFASPARPFLGEVGGRASHDGWRDDKFPRKIGFHTTSLKLLENAVADGLALAYLPDYIGEREGWRRLKVTGCPYSCTQKIRIVAREPEDMGWLSWLF